MNQIELRKECKIGTVDCADGQTLENSATYKICSNCVHRAPSGLPEIFRCRFHDKLVRRTETCKQFTGKAVVRT